MRPLNPLTLNLHGQILIEASAGTGKTYTIALLFLRMLLERGLTVDEILVVTFTNAAAEELRGRIRQRIRDALDVLEDRGPDDPLLHELMAKTASNQDRAVVLLGDALTRMDEAAVYTIHSFCQRMLQDHAFESGAPFEMEFLETEQLLRNRIMEDFWRQRFYSASQIETAWAASLWESPQNLLAGLGGHLGRTGVKCIPLVSDNDLEELATELAPLFSEIKIQWRQCREEIAELLRENKRLSRDKRKGYGQPQLASALEALDRFVDSANMPWLAVGVLELFTSSKIAGSLKKNKTAPPEHPFFDLFEHFLQAHQKMSDTRKIAVLLEARNFLQNELIRRKKEQSQLYFDDLLTCLAAGLQGTDGKELAQGIGRRFPVIMVDEFQDTDPLQYRIFADIHAANMDNAAEEEKRSAGLFLIGDPKQAIYSFRGADIFTYIEARQDTATANQLTMTKNYRSSTPMVMAVNQLFSRDAPFLFAKNEIDFPHVEAAGPADTTPFLVDGRPPDALTCLLLNQATTGKALSKDAAKEQAARFCAHEVAHLLAAGLADRGKIGDQPITAGDFAVLVRTHAEANLIRRELNALAVTTACSSQESVFSSKEAGQVRLLMTCLNELSDNALVRTVLAGDLFGFNAEQIDRLRDDEQEWEQVMTAMSRYRQVWQEQGFLPMFQWLLNEQQVVGRLNVLPAGERMLTNFLHLAELLQEAGRQRIGMNALLRWFIDQIHFPEEQAENQQLRLESDENLVKIVTIHKAKGMEYPLIFLPFLWSGRPISADEPPAFHRPDQPDRLSIDFGTARKAEHLRLAERERLAEDLRLLYVALTRAKYGCFFCWGRINKMEQSALCYLLHQEALSLAQIAADLEQAELEVKLYPEIFSRPAFRSKDKEAGLNAVRFSGRVNSEWRITSYSSLVAHQDSKPEQPDYDQAVSEEEQAPGHDVFGFPKGAAAGICLHAILELISFDDSNNHEEVIQSQLARAGFNDSWLPVVSEWMRAVLDTRLQGKDGLFSLSNLTEAERVNEMSFYFPLESMSLERFNQILQKFDYAPLPDRHEKLEGLMVGFIDLVFCYQGRYYLADYKSNHLGNRAVDYHPDSLGAAMIDHRYDLQYLIYTLALHRFLAGRIRDYDYNTHFGGALYLFLRGMHPDHESGTGVFSAVPPLALIEALDRCCAGK